ncbi:MAG: hypothetical protein GY811_02600 [Myxococcales bacterium]|nr:hypothetical protein [Myxococcales bacterium]
MMRALFLVIGALAILPLEVSAEKHSVRRGSDAGTRVSIYLDGGGAWLRAKSSPLLSTLGRDRLRVPAYGGDAETWSELSNCVEERFSDFQIDVTSRRPLAKHIRVLIGGSSSILGLGPTVHGLAEYTGDAQLGATVLVFEQGLRGQSQDLCEAVIHEVGHALGLDHAYACKDPMSYLSGCGQKRFQNMDVSCGEDGERTCQNGDDSQNSYAQIAAVAGLRDRPRLAPPDIEDTTRFDELDSVDIDWEEIDTAFLGVETDDELLALALALELGLVLDLDPNLALELAQDFERSKLQRLHRRVVRGSSTRKLHRRTVRERPARRRMAHPNPPPLVLIPPRWER